MDDIEKSLMEGKEAEKIDFTFSSAETDMSVESKWALKDRLKSPVLWSALVGCVITIFSVLGIWEKIGITSEQFSNIVGAIGTMLTAFGILNNPTSREEF